MVFSQRNILVNMPLYEMAEHFKASMKSFLNGSCMVLTSLLTGRSNHRVNVEENTRPQCEIQPELGQLPSDKFQTEFWW